MIHLENILKNYVEKNMFDDFYFLFLAVVGAGLLTGISAAIVASNKGRDVTGWFLLGFILGPIGIVLSLVVSRNEENLQEHAVASGEFRVCEYCAELVKFQAKICKHCGKELPKLSKPEMAAHHLYQPDPKAPKAPKSKKWDGNFF